MRWTRYRRRRARVLRGTPVREPRYGAAPARARRHPEGWHAARTSPLAPGTWPRQSLLPWLRRAAAAVPTTQGVPGRAHACTPALHACTPARLPPSHGLARPPLLTACLACPLVARAGVRRRGGQCGGWWAAAASLFLPAGCCPPAQPAPRRPHPPSAVHPAHPSLRPPAHRPRRRHKTRRRRPRRPSACCCSCAARAQKRLAPLRRRPAIFHP